MSKNIIFFLISYIVTSCNSEKTFYKSTSMSQEFVLIEDNTGSWDSGGGFQPSSPVQWYYIEKNYQLPHGYSDIYQNPQGETLTLLYTPTILLSKVSEESLKNDFFTQAEVYTILRSACDKSVEFEEAAFSMDTKFIYMHWQNKVAALTKEVVGKYTLHKVSCKEI